MSYIACHVPSGMSKNLRSGYFLGSHISTPPEIIGQARKLVFLEQYGVPGWALQYGFLDIFLKIGRRKKCHQQNEIGALGQVDYIHLFLRHELFFVQAMLGRTLVQSVALFTLNTATADTKGS